MGRSPFLAGLGAVLAASLLVVSLGARADTLSEANKLFKQKNYAQALNKVDSYLSSHPKDAQARFLKGLILTEQNQRAEAIQVFSALTQDYPELPEPYNNLAVLYAAEGKYDKARVALEMAIRTHPAYATAHENLGDIYAKLASEAYNKALQLDQSNSTAQTKLALIKELFTVNGASSPIKLGGASPAAARPAAPPARPASPPQAQEKEDRDGKDKESKVASQKSAPGKPVASSDRQEVIDTVRQWAQAWSAKDVKAYLAFYGKGFVPPAGESRSAWEKTRAERITRPKAIRVTISSPRVEFPDAAHARVTFKQSYRSDTFHGTTAKMLTLAKSGNKWLIEREEVAR